MDIPKAAHAAYVPEALPPSNVDLVQNSHRRLTDGLNVLCADAQSNPLGISLHLCVSQLGQRYSVPSSGLETALIPITGTGVMIAGDTRVPFSRANWRDESPCVLHLPAEVPVRIEGGDGRAEVAIIQTRNDETFDVRVLLPEQIASERRGEGFADNMSLRIVRTAFDHTNAPRQSKMVLGEVVNLPGKWSSYPGHIHPQPEWYLYKFDKPGAYGKGTNGDRTYDVRENDVLRIHPNHRHEQVSAPNFWMYYIWAVRHLPQNLYTGFTYQDQRHVDAWYGVVESFSREK
jgi:5-deoxy-glucuronate isomerase